MASRRQRKRKRLEVEPSTSAGEATAKTPGFAGGWGRGLPRQRGDLAMIRRAVREGWETPQSVKDRVMDELMREFEAADDRQAIRIVRLFIAIDRANIDAEFAEIELARRIKAAD